MNFIIHFLKGVAMGAANVIPGVSGGTIALITGIFERIINAIKNTFSIQSVKLFFTGKLKQWAAHTDFMFVMALGAGVLVAMISIAKVLGFLFENYPVYVWAFFFGLVLASVWFVARTVKKFNSIAIIFFIIGAAIALSMALLKPMGENQDVLYLTICGAVAACSMILPGLSGSFVLVLMGNYELVMIHAINEGDFAVLLPVVLGAGAGLLVFSYVLAWIFKRFKDQTISLLSGFMLGSLLIIWPWKEAIMKQDTDGSFLLNRSGDMIVERYAWNIPQQLNTSVFIAVAFILAGMAVIVITETIAAKKNKPSSTSNEQ
jgi:putative membrane protein